MFSFLGSGHFNNFVFNNVQCVLPAGVELYSSGFDTSDASTFPRSYPIVLTGIFCNCFLVFVCICIFILKTDFFIIKLRILRY